MAEDFIIFKEDLKSRVDIVDVVQEFVELKKGGSNHLGLCPFHTEKSPSFSVNRSGQFYHCFGCGKGGDVIGFLMDITGMSFMEAVEQLAERVGMEIPQTRGSDPSRREEAELAARANLAAAEHFYRTLFESAGTDALAYLTNRGLSEDTIRAFRLGYVTSDSKGLTSHIRDAGLAPTALETAGIMMSSKFGGPPKNRFANRVVFPIIDQVKRVIGFGGRIMEGDGPKYLNSPETPVYHKSRVLFGIPQAMAAIKLAREAIVVEGYMDVIALHQAGIENVIAASGTAFTVEQARIIGRMANRVLLLFDGDNAGLAAASRGADSFLTTDLTVGIVILPEGHDPDSFVGEHGADALRERLADALDIWEFKLRTLADGGERTVSDRMKLAGEVADSISMVEDELKRDIYIDDLSVKINVSRNEMRKAVAARRRRTNRSRESENNTRSEMEPTDQRELLGYIIRNPDLARHFMEDAGAKPFVDETSRMVAEEIFNRIVEGLDISPTALIGALTDPKAQELVSAVAMVERDPETAARCIEDNIRRFKERELRSEIREIGSEAARETNSKKKQALVAKQQKIFDRIRALNE
jgi:DNA primase